MRIHAGPALDQMQEPAHGAMQLPPMSAKLPGSDAGAVTLHTPNTLSTLYTLYTLHTLITLNTPESLRNLPAAANSRSLVKESIIQGAAICSCRRFFA